MTLSIITIAYNNLTGLQKTIESVFSQTCRDFEHIIIDGNSQDGSKEYLKEATQRAAELDIPFQYVSEPDTGIYNAMNKGIEKSSGEYCLFLNSGDYLSYDSVLEELFANQPIADIVSCNAVFDASVFHKERYCISPAEITAGHLILSYLPHQATLIRTALFKKIGCYDESFKVVSDWLFFIDAILNNGASYQHIQMFLSHCETEGISNNPENNELMRNEFERGVRKVVPLFANDYIQLKYYKGKESNEQVKFLFKFAKTKLFRVIWKIRNHLFKWGFYEKKAKYQQKRLLRRLVNEDRLLKKEVAAKIYTLPKNMLHPTGKHEDMIVSLTSYGKRLEDAAPYAIYSLFTQTVLPARIVLYLDDEHWNDDNLPDLIKRLRESGLEVRYCSDIRSYKKLIPALKDFPNNPIITTDDDFYYEEHLIERQIQNYKNSDKKTVLGAWGCIPRKVNGQWMPYSTWKDSQYANSKTAISFFGCCCCYPPHIFDNEILNEEVFMKLCPTADDIWFWIQEQRCGVKTQIVDNINFKANRSVNRIEEYDYSQVGTLFHENVIFGRNDKQLLALVDYYNL